MRLNPLNGRWVTIVSDRAHRPRDFAPRQPAIEADPDRPCPFCPGNEDATLPALDTVDAGGTWQMRVIPNLYPAFGGGSGFVVHHVGPVHVIAEATGTHEVFVYSRDHDGGLADLDDEQAGGVDARAQAPPRRPRRRPGRSLHAGDRQPRPRGGRLARPPARPDPRSAVRAHRGPRRGAGVRPLRRWLRDLHDDRRRGAQRRPGRVRRRRRGVRRAVLERRAVRAAADAAPPRRRTSRPPTTTASRRWAGRSATSSPSSTRRSATSPSTSASTAHRTSTPASTTGTSTSGRTSSPRPGFERGTGVMINVVPPEDAAASLRVAHAGAAAV